VGWADFATSRAGLVWSDNGELTVLPSLGEGVQVSSQRINNSGEVLVAGAGNGRQLSYVWDAARGYRQLAQPVGMHDSYGYDINDAGQVVGIAASSLSDGSPYHAVLWSGLNDALDLGGLPGATNNYAMAINAASAVVGQSWEAAGIRSFIWTASEGMRNLALLIDGVDPLAGRLGSLAMRDINDGGQILGSALIDGQRRALLLSPVPESGTALMLAMGLTPVACIVRRREAVGCRHRAPNRKCEQALVKARTAAWIFLNRLPVANCAVKLSKLITDNGSQFADRFTSRKRAPKGRLKLYEVPIPPDC